MADHLRKQIRDAAVTALTGLTTTGANVFPTRFYPQDVANLPCILVYTLAEENEILSTGNAGALLRNLVLEVDVIAQATADIDDTMDQICKEVEIALMTDPTLGGLCKNSWLENMEMEFDAIGEKPIGVIKNLFKIKYVSVKNAPDTSK